MAEQQEVEQEESDEIPDEVIEKSNEFGDRIFSRVIEDCDDRDDVDLGGVAFYLFVSAVHLLAARGCKPEELAKEALEHAQDELSRPDEGDTVN